MNKPLDMMWNPLYCSKCRGGFPPLPTYICLHFYKCSGWLPTVIWQMFHLYPSLTYTHLNITMSTHATSVKVLNQNSTLLIGEG